MQGQIGMCNEKFFAPFGRVANVGANRFLIRKEECNSLTRRFDLPTAFMAIASPFIDTPRPQIQSVAATICAIFRKRATHERRYTHNTQMEICQKRENFYGTRHETPTLLFP